MCVKITFADARIWRYITTSASKFIETAVIKISPDEGLSLKALDPSRTALIAFTIPKESFDEFDINEESTLVIDLEDVGKIMKTAERDDRISIEWTGSSISFIFERRGVPRRFMIPLRTEGEAESIPELSLELNNEYVTSGTVAYDAINSIEDVGETLWISGDENTLKLRSISDLGEAEVELSLERGTLESAKAESPGFSVSFGMEYFSYLKQPIKLSDKVILRADSDMPAHLELSYMQGAKLSYYVAPRSE